MAGSCPLKTSERELKMRFGGTAGREADRRGGGGMRERVSDFVTAISTPQHVESRSVL